MPDESSKNAFEQGAVWLGGGGALAALGVLLRGLFTGATGQESEVRKTLQDENKRLWRVAKNALAWEALARQARSEAEKLGYDASKWPPDPFSGEEDE